MAEHRPPPFGLPSRVTVDALSYTVRAVPAVLADNEQIFGMCDSLTQSLLIRADVSSPERAAETFVHELFHAIFRERGMEQFLPKRNIEQLEELIVGALSAGWSAILANNPGLGTKLDSMLRRDT
jgi:hypothetical protein